jgi:hypothetical protein
VLEAGRRAEAQGQVDYAVQFYRHLIDYYPASGEASSARDALQRLSPRAGFDPATTGSTPPSSTTAAVPPPPPYRNGATQWSPAGGNADQAGREAHRETTGGRAASSQRPDPPPRAMAAPPREYGGTPGTMRGLPLELPPVVRGYLFGRVLAILVVALGAILFLVGFVMLGFALTTGSVPVVPPVGPPAAIGGVLVLLGAVLLFAGQTALATFATANATRDQAAVLRLIAEDMARRRW